MDPLLLILLLVAGATILLVGDLFLPTGGIMSIVGVGLLLTATIVCFTINRWLGLAVLFGLTISSPFVAAGMIKAWQHTPIGKRMTLADAPLPTPRGPAVRVGREGRTLSALRPMGEAEFINDSGQLVTVQAKCEFGDLPPGAAVRVVHFKDELATVRPIAANAAPALNAVEPSDPVI